MLKRHAYDQLLDWKNRKTKQGLLVTGARQVGKTTLIEQFGADHYEHVAEVNFIEMPQAVETVSKAKDVEDLDTAVIGTFRHGNYAGQDSAVS